MIERELIGHLRLVHGAFNCAVAALLVRQGWHGLAVRRARRKGVPDLTGTRRHRRNGPVIALLGLLGYAAGITVIYLDRGRVFHFKAHFINGSLIALMLAALYLSSRRIRGGDSPWRPRHAALGAAVLCLYAAQVLSGIGVLL